MPKAVEQNNECKFQLPIDNNKKGISHLGKTNLQILQML